MELAHDVVGVRGRGLHTVDASNAKAKEKRSRLGLRALSLPRSLLLPWRTGCSFL